MATFRKRKGTWHVQIRRSGCATLTRSFKHKADAEAWARGVESEIDQGGTPGDRRALKRHTVADLLVRYRATVTPRKRGFLQEQCRLDQLLRHPIAMTPLAQATPGLFARYRDERLLTVQGVTVRRELALIRHVLTTALREWEVPLAANPVAQIKLPPIPQARTRRVIGDELDRLLAACRQRRNITLEAAITLATETGMRRGELLSVRWREVYIQSRTLYIPTSKTGRARTVPLSRMALEAITTLPRRDERVIPLSPNALRLAWERLRRRAGVTGLRWHDLRHEAASRFFERGLNIAEVAAILGHSDYRMLARYVHPRAEDIAAKLG